MYIGRRTRGIMARYLLILLFSLFYSGLYVILAPLTIYFSYFLISLLYPAGLSGNVISFNGKEIELIDACISGLAYLLLLVLNLSVEMRLKRRFRALAFSLGMFFAFNCLRIVLLSLALASSFFSYLHAFFWYFGSIIAVLAIWIMEIRIFRIKDIPFISDMMRLWKLVKN